MSYCAENRRMRFLRTTGVLIQKLLEKLYRKAVSSRANITPCAFVVEPEAELDDLG
jgi:hypothetical protein